MWQTFGQRGLVMWAIYERPADHPEHFVVRPYVIDSGEIYESQTCTLHASLEEARAALPPGLHCLPREDGDEPQIIETWF